MLGELESSPGPEATELSSDISRANPSLYVRLNIFGSADEILKTPEHGLYFCFPWIEVNQKGRHGRPQESYAENMTSPAP